MVQLSAVVEAGHVADEGGDGGRQGRRGVVGVERAARLGVLPGRQLGAEGLLQLGGGAAGVDQQVPRVDGADGEPLCVQVVLELLDLGIGPTEAGRELMLRQVVAVRARPRVADLGDEGVERLVVSGVRLIATDIRFPAATLPVWVASWFRPLRTSPVMAARVECGWAVPAA